MPISDKSEAAAKERALRQQALDALKIADKLGDERAKRVILMSEVLRQMCYPAASDK